MWLTRPCFRRGEYVDPRSPGQPESGLDIRVRFGFITSSGEIRRNVGLGLFEILLRHHDHLVAVATAHELWTAFDRGIDDVAEMMSRRCCLPSIGHGRSS